MRYLIALLFVVFWINNVNAGLINHHKLAVQGGYWFYSESNNQDFNGPYISLEYEYLFNKYFGLAISNGAGGNFKNNYQGSKVDYMKIISGLLITPKYYFPSSKNILPFVGLGFGSYAREIKKTVNNTTSAEEYSGIGYQGLVGVDFTINDYFSLSIEDRYSIVKFDDTEDVSGNNIYIGINWHL